MLLICKGRQLGSESAVDITYNTELFIMLMLSLRINIPFKRVALLGAKADLGLLGEADISAVSHMKLES